MLRWFRRGERLTQSQLEALAHRHARPAVHLAGVDASQGLSRLGGVPPLPPGVPWPLDAGTPMVCLGTLDLGEIAALQRLPWLPREGQLSFFCNLESTREDGTLPCRVLHLQGADASATTPSGNGVQTRFVVLRAHASWPSRERLERDAGPFRSADGDYDALLDARFGGQLRHQVGGYPDVLQYDDMEQRCARQVDGDAGAPQSSPDDWCLLLQIDGADDRLLPWTDWGTFYFWIERAAAERGDFDRVQLLFQTT